MTSKFMLERPFKGKNLVLVDIDWNPQTDLD